MSHDKISHEKYLERVLAEGDKNVEVLGRYTGNSDPIAVRCRVCGNCWKPRASSLYKHGCRKCSGANRAKASRLTDQQFKSQMATHGNPFVELIGAYLRYATKIEVRCKKCGNCWEALPSNLLAGSACGKCASREVGAKRAKPPDRFEAALVNRGINLIGEYKNKRVKIEVECATCKHVWLAMPGNLLSGSGCLLCGRLRSAEVQMKTHDQFLGEFSISGNPLVELIGTYQGAYKKIKVRCKTCNYIWCSSPGHLLKGVGCVKCQMAEKSRGERATANLLDALGVRYEFEKSFPSCRYKGQLSFDFYLPKFKTIIEIDGEQHYTGWGGDLVSLESIQKRDRLKDEWAVNNRLLLCRIPYRTGTKPQEVANKVRGFLVAYGFIQPSLFSTDLVLLDCWGNIAPNLASPPTWQQQTFAPGEP